MAATETIEATAVETAMAEVTALLEAAKAPPVDPLGRDGRVVQTGDILTEEQVRTYLIGNGRHRSYSAESCGLRCAGVPMIGTYGYCQRIGQHGAELPHVVVTEDREVAWAWQTGEIPVDPTPDEFTDPDDATVEAFTQGLRVNYRNKRDILFVLSAPRRKDETVELIDLTHQRMRKVKKDLLVPVREDDPAPSQDEMRWMGVFIAGRRQSALDIALREHANARWSREEMNESLAKIDIAPRPVRYGTSFSVTIDLTLPDGQTSLDDFKDGSRYYSDALQRVIEAGLRAEAPGYTVRRVRDIYGGNVDEVRRG